MDMNTKLLNFLCFGSWYNGWEYLLCSTTLILAFIVKDIRWYHDLTNRECMPIQDSNSELSSVYIHLQHDLIAELSSLINSRR